MLEPAIIAVCVTIIVLVIVFAVDRARRAKEIRDAARQVLTEEAAAVQRDAAKQLRKPIPNLTTIYKRWMQKYSSSDPPR